MEILPDVREIAPTHAAVHVALTLAVTATYVGAILALGRLLPADTVHESLLFNVAFIVGVAAVFEPLRSRLQHGVDRIFFRQRADYRRTIGEVSTALTSLLDLDRILERVIHAVVDGVQIRSLSIMLWLDDGAQQWDWDVAEGRVRLATVMPVDAVRAELAKAPHELWKPTLRDEGEEELHRRAVDEAEALGAVLCMPLTLESRPIGMLALGAKHSGHPFSTTDLHILSTLAAQTAIAVKNAHSYQALAQLNARLEHGIQERTAALRASNAELESSNAELGRAYRELQSAQAQLVQSEKMASLGVLVAGVAHEINNPVSFIATNVAPLRKRLANVRDLARAHQDGQLASAVERVSEVLEVISRGAERTTAIVRDLRTFSSPGETQPRPFDLHEGIEVSLRLLRPRWAERIVIHRDYGTISTIEAVPSQINQVLMNLLANACDAIPDQGNIWISTRADGANVRIAIRDDGAGIADENRGRIFDPFFTTKPMGKGTGLGLAISHGLVTHHGGTIELQTASGVGTEFTVVLPRHPELRLA